MDEGAEFAFYPKAHLDGRTDFILRPPAAFSGRVMGMGGAHLRCIQLIGEILGREVNQQWEIYWENPTDIQNRASRSFVPVPDEHDTSDAELLLTDLLEACGVNASVHVQGAIAAGFDFVIVPDAHQDKAALCDPWPAIYPRTKRGSPPINFIVAIRTIFKAIGLAKGVVYRTDIA